MKPPLIVLSCLTLTLFSCKKDDAPIPSLQNGTYTNNWLAETGPVLLFAGNQPITDKVFIHNYLQRYLSDWITDSTIREQEGKSVLFEYTSLTVSGDSIAYFQDHPETPTFRDTFHINNNDFRTKLLVSNRLSAMPGADDGVLSCTNASRYVRRNPPVYRCNYFDFGFLVPSYCPGYQQFPLIIKDDYVIIPMMMFFFLRPLSIEEFCYGAEIYIWDEFNTDIINRLRPNDTLVLQTYYVKLRKQ